MPVENIKEKILKSDFVGFCGFAQTGKDSAGLILKEIGFQRVSLADPVRQGIYNINPLVVVDNKRSYEIPDNFLFREIVDITLNLTFIRLQNVVNSLGWDESKKIPEVRRLLQYYGTEGGRDIFGQTIWTDTADKYIKDNKIEKVVISDIRFPNELEWLRSKNNSTVIKVERKGIGPVNGHSSDKGISDTLCDFIINNDGSLVDLKNKLI